MEKMSKTRNAPARSQSESGEVAEKSDECRKISLDLRQAARHFRPGPTHKSPAARTCDRALVRWANAYLIFIFLPFDFTLASAGTVMVPGAEAVGLAVVVVDSTVVDDGLVSVIVPVMGEVVVVAGVVVVLRVVVVVVPVWALAE